MKVRAKYNFAYKGVAYLGGDVFEVTEKELADIRTDIEFVTEVKTVEVKREVAKIVTGKRTVRKVK